MNDNNKKPDGNKSNNQKALIIVGSVFAVLFLGIIFLGSVVFYFANSDNSQQQVQQSKPIAKDTQPKKEEAQHNQTKITKSDADKTCQDFIILKNYINTKKVSIIDIWNYNDYLTETGEGEETFQWNGKNKDDDSSVLFVCDVTKKDGKAVVKSLAIDANLVYASP